MSLRDDSAEIWFGEIAPEDLRRSLFLETATDVIVRHEAESTELAEQHAKERAELAERQRAELSSALLRGSLDTEHNDDNRYILKIQPAESNLDKPSRQFELSDPLDPKKVTLPKDYLNDY